VINYKALQLGIWDIVTFSMKIYCKFTVKSACKRILRSVNICLNPVHTSNMSKQHVEFNMLLRHVEHCFDVSNVADFFVLSTCHTSNMSKQHFEFDMLKQHVELCFDMLPVAVRNVASTCCWCGRGFTGKKADCLTCSVCLGTVLLKDEELASYRPWVWQETAVVNCCYIDFDLA